MTFPEILRPVCLFFVCLVALCYFYQGFYLYIPFFKKRPLPENPKPRRYAILIAARNEAAVIAHLLDSIRDQDYPAELISTFVVADNCTDATARIAASHGATVFQRFDKQLVGKGYALKYLLEQIDGYVGLDSFDCFMIFDADNLLEPDYIRKMNALPEAGYEAFCGYRNSKNFTTNWITSGYALWYLHESTHMNRSRFAIGSCCAVNGTGFGFTRGLIRRLGGWRFFTLTEDLEFHNWCATHGVKIGYCHDAILYDEQPETFPVSWKQRTRWAQGGIQVSMKFTGKLLKGLFHGGWVGHSCMEFLSRSSLCYILAGFTAVLSALTIFLTVPWPGILIYFLWALVGGYLGTCFVALLTVLKDNARIRANTRQKIRAILLFPFFVATFLPISILAVFRKFEWTPTEHTVAISVEELQLVKKIS